MLFFMITYKRPLAMMDLADELSDEKLYIMDDRSPMRLFCRHRKHEIDIQRLHRGRDDFFRIWNRIFDLFEASDEEMMAVIPDDWKNLELDRIKNVPFQEGTFASNVTNVGWNRSWTPIEKQDSIYPDFYRVGWIDHGMITNRDTVKLIPRMTHNNVPVSRTSSGVGAFLSRLLYQNGVPMFTPKVSMAEHREDCSSIMNADERNKRPLWALK